MYVNINRYLKIYLSNPPYTYIGPRANTWELTIDKIDKFEPRNVNNCKIPLILFMFFETFSAFLCYRRNFWPTTKIKKQTKNFAITFLFRSWGRFTSDHFHSLSLNILFLFSFPLLFVTENDQQNRPRDQESHVTKRNVGFVVSGNSPK